MRRMALLVLTLAAGCIAVDAAEDEEDSETEQSMWDGSSWDGDGESIVVQGGLDPCWTGLCWPTSWPTDPGPSYTGDAGGPGGGGQEGGAADPHPIPAPRDCTAEPTWEQCYTCCDWNSKHVWEETCRRMRKEDRRRCWERVENELRPECYESCKRPGGPITTVAP